MKIKQCSNRRTPIYRDAGFVFETLEEAKCSFAKEGQAPQSAGRPIYTRYGNPSVSSAEAALKELEHSGWAVLTSSGMAAIDTALSIFQERGPGGPWLFFSELYGGTRVYIDEIVQKRRGIDVVWVEPRDGKYSLEDFRAKLESRRPRLVFYESVSNPYLIVPDCKEIIRMVRDFDRAMLEKEGPDTAAMTAIIVDNTFGTPMLWRPLKDGADLVIHSATKYLGGHGDLTAGVICGDCDKLNKAAMQYRKLVGNILSPDDAYRLEEQLKTFEMRFERQCGNASRLADLLSRRGDKVAKVLYPALDSHPSRAEARALFDGDTFGAMVTFQLEGGLSASKVFVSAINEIIPFVPTLGDADSSLLHVSSVFGDERDESQGMIRLSVGCEPWDTLGAAIDRALDCI